MSRKKIEKKGKVATKTTTKKNVKKNVSENNIILDKLKQFNVKTCAIHVLDVILILWFVYLLICFTQVNMHSCKIYEDFEYPAWNFLGRM